ncbi:PLP-dependent aminotransferase family protein [Pedobacter agri]|uniref:aminotransferase-like domain-containing protein n=1 Tax=Pedobacter agri TaxID=454586 RepID=UPI002931D6D6|nr:PLP-dependent aminotransferase family protein [Pedobacter agri]
MDSPVQIPFKSFIQLDSSASTPIYLQIVFEFIKAIQLGLLPEGTKLPGTRMLCKLLNVNRNTLIKAFQDLESQGFIAISPSKGTFILSSQKQAHQKEIGVLSRASTTPHFNFKRSTILEDPIEVSELPLQFNDGLPDARLVHTDVLAGLYVSKLKRNKNKKVWGQVQQQTRANFKKQFSNYLNVTRGLKIAEANLLTTTNHEIGLYLVLKLLISAGDKVVIASPGYYQSNMSILDSGAEIISVPVDQDGIDTVQLRKICETNTIRILYLTSVFHYPTTIALSAKRRIEILEMASQFGFIIVEDDYDFDFHFDNNTILPLAAIDSNSVVVYIGSFAKSLPSGFGYGFVSAPASFIEELEKHQRILSPGVDVIKEQVLADWIQEGEVHRLSKKNKKNYRERRDYFIKLLEEKFKGKIDFHIPHRGLAVWVNWLGQFNLIKLRKKCMENGLFLPKTILYQNKNLTASRLGFGSMDLKEMDKALTILSASLNELLLQN